MGDIGGTRLRTLQAAIVMVALLAFGGAFTILELPKHNNLEVAAFFAASLCCLVLLPLAARASARGDRIMIERLGMIVLGILVVLILQRIIATLYGPMFKNPGTDFFRLHFACTVLLYLAAVALMRARPALRFSWLMLAVFVVVTLPGVYQHTGWSMSRPGVASLLVWLLLANPLAILLLHALPKYEEQIDRQAAEVAEMRTRTELIDKLSESERRFNLVVQGLEVGVWDRWIGPPEKRWWSPRFYELLGYSPDELPATEDHLKSLLHPDDRDKVWEEGTKQLRENRTMDIDFRLRTRNRGYRWFNSRARAELDGSGRMIRLAGSIADIHDKRTAEDALHGAQVELTRLSYRDSLTDLHNRRYFDEHFQREWERSRRNRQPLALVLIDLDHFKAYNDQYGHPAGDAALVKVAQLLSRSANRATDIVARLGGEEFGIVLPEATAAGGEEVARRVLAQLVALGIPHSGAPEKVMTLSAGVAAIEGPEGPGPSELFQQADQALYEAKRRGRNGTVRFGAERAASAA